MHCLINSGTDLDADHAIDLATALGVGIEEAAQDGELASVSLCCGPLQRQAYWDFLASQELDGRTIQEAHPQATVMMVHLAGRPVGAAALLPDSSLGLPLPDAFQEVADRLRREGRILALLDPLIVAADLPSRGAGLVLRGMLRLAILAARRLDGQSDILVRCEARYARFFAQALLFHVEAEQQSLPDGTPSQLLLRLDLDLCPGEWLRLYGEARWSPYSLYIRPTPQATRVIAWLRTWRKPPSIGELVACWIDGDDGTTALDQPTLRRLCRLYPGLAVHAAIRHMDETCRTERKSGTGPIPRIRTPLPFDDA